jgi:hypothetical protein
MKTVGIDLTALWSRVQFRCARRVARDSLPGA